jgi:shikimate kinase
MDYTNQNIVFIGMPGVGKTTVGTVLAKRLGRHFYDSNEYITQKLGAAPGALIEARGEVYFRHKEALVVTTLLSNAGAVIALGEAAVLDPDVMHALKKHIVIWLSAPESVLLARLSDDAKLLFPGDNKAPLIKAMLDKLQPLYTSIATYHININDKTPKVLVEELCALLGVQPQ